jgi:hypothetical protein
VRCPYRTGLRHEAEHLQFLAVNRGEQVKPSSRGRPSADAIAEEHHLPVEDRPVSFRT